MAALVEDHKCSICMVGYTQDRPPKVLACGHSFCPPCADNATCPTCKQQGPGSPPTPHVPSLEQPKTTGQRQNLAASSYEPSLTAVNDDSLPYRQIASHGSFCVRGAAGGTVLHLSWPGDANDVRRLVETIEPPLDAFVWYKYWSDPPQMPSTMKSIRVRGWWAPAVQGIRQAEESGRNTVALMPYSTSPITPLVDYVTSRRQHAATHIIVMTCVEDQMTKWQQQLVADARMMELP